MHKYKWADEFSVGNSTLDEQHKELIDILNMLQDKLMGDIQEYEVLQSLRQLQVYAAEHFALEERFMAEMQDSLPSYAQHLQEHREFTDMVNSLIMSFVQEGAAIAWKLFIFLAEWLIDHICKTDALLKGRLPQEAAS